MDFRKGIIEAKNVPDKVWMRKSFSGWKVVHPIKNEDGSINWFNLLVGGSWANIIKIIIIVIFILLVVYEYSSNIKFLSQCCELSSIKIIP